MPPLPTQIVFENFTSTTGNFQSVDVAQDPSKPVPFHKLIQGFLPNYGDIVNETMDANVYKKVSPPHPLILARKGTASSATNLGRPNVFLPSFQNALVTVVTSRGELWYTGPITTHTGQYYPLTIATKNMAADDDALDGAFFNGYVYLAVSSSDANISNGVYFGTLSSVNTPITWTAVSGVAITSPRFTEVYKTNVYYSDTSAGIAVDRRLVQYINSGNIASAGLDLGPGWYVDAIKNWDNNLLAIVAHQSSGIYTAADSQYSPEYYLYLWNGLPNNSYDYARSINGFFHSMAFKSKNKASGIFGSDPSTMYVFVQQGADAVAYRLHNFSLVETARLHNVTLRSYTANPRHRVSVWGNYFKLTTTQGVLWWNTDTNEAFIGENEPTGQAISLIANFAGAMNLSFDGEYYSIYARNSTTTWQEWYPHSGSAITQATYQSNYVRIPKVVPQTGEALPNSDGRGKINRATIIWDGAPPSASDTIVLSITYKDELTDDTYHTFAVTLSNNVAGSSATFDGGAFADANIVVDTKRGYLENIGALATEVSIKMVVSPTMTTWVPNIKRIVLDWTPVSMQP